MGPMDWCSMSEKVLPGSRNRDSRTIEFIRRVDLDADGVNMVSYETLLDAREPRDQTKPERVERQNQQAPHSGAVVAAQPDQPVARGRMPLLTLSTLLSASGASRTSPEIPTITTGRSGPTRDVQLLFWY